MTKIDLFLYWYTLIFSGFLIVTAVLNGLNLSNLTTLAFYLPVPTYLLLQSSKRYHLSKIQEPSPSHDPVKFSLPFNLKYFLTQKHPLFIITLVLLLTAWLISLLKSL